MPTASPQRRVLAGKIGKIQGLNGPDDARLPRLRRALDVERLADHIRQVVERAPPLTAEQAERLRALLPALDAGNGDVS